MANNCSREGMFKVLDAVDCGATPVDDVDDVDVGIDVVGCDKDGILEGTDDDDDEEDGFGGMDPPPPPPPCC